VNRGLKSDADAAGIAAIVLVYGLFAVLLLRGFVMLRRALRR